MSGIPAHAYGEAKKAAEELIQEGFIIPKSTNYGLQISFNPSRLEEIRKILETEG